MLDVLLKTLPFFALIVLGYGAAWLRFFSEDATRYLTRFVFYFALSAMLFRFSANLSLGQVLNWDFVLAYLGAGLLVYLLVTAVAMRRTKSMAQAAVEAQCAVVGNVGFLGVPMLALLIGERAVGPVMLVLAIDLTFFGSLIVILITIAREGRMRLGVFAIIARGLLANPMIVSISLGLLWSELAWPIPAPVDEFLILLGAAATPGALFAIGASLAAKSTERMSVAVWLSFCKLVLHPAAVALFAIVIFQIEPFMAAVMVAAAALPVAGNVYILAQHYKVAPQRVSASILVSTALSIVTVSVIVGWVTVALIA
jgi:predicted permease